ncbi:ADP-ribosylation factor GTPase-activating protein AGD4-like isoform X2 [Aristolochia californica]
MSIKKGTRAEVVAGLEEDLHNSKSSFERCRFHLVTSLTNIEAKKKFLFLESISAVMDAHLRYFKLGYEMLSQMEPYIHQVLTFVQQSKEMAVDEQDKLAKRIQEYRTQVELENLNKFSAAESSTSGDGIHFVGMSSYKDIEALMQSTANGKVETIKEGYLLKRSSGLRGDWRRRFFVLDSHGSLNYYRTKWSKTSVANSLHSTGAPEHSSGMFGRFRFNHNRAASQGEETLGCHTVDLRTSTIKMDAEQSDLRFCFRIISPLKIITLQAENGAERKDWVDKITGVIASLITSPLQEQLTVRADGDNNGSAEAGGTESLLSDGNNCSERSEDESQRKTHDNVSRMLREIPGNNICAECSSPEPDWASLNLGILMCIECSGVHRNLGVHISKVRSLTLDVKVWEPTILDLFRILGNDFCNSVWEDLLEAQDQGKDESNSISVIKPGPKDAFSRKEKYIQSKYVDKLLIVKRAPESDTTSHATAVWEAVRTGDIRAAYRLLVMSDAKPNTSYDVVNADDLSHPAEEPDQQNNRRKDKLYDPMSCSRIKDSGNPSSCLQGWSLLHLACHGGDFVMVELLLQFGADVNKQDFHGRTPVHHCIALRNESLTKYLLRRGARPTIRDAGGQTPLEREMEIVGAITDEQLFVLLAGND